MISEFYSKDELIQDINLLISLDLIDYKLREDGEWVYAITEKGRQMTDSQVGQVIDTAIEARNKLETTQEE